MLFYALSMALKGSIFMQRVLTFTVDKKKYTSKPFDFEAFRLTNENHADDTKKGAVTCGMEDVYKRQLWGSLSKRTEGAGRS